MIIWSVVSHVFDSGQALVSQAYKLSQIYNKFMSFFKFCTLARFIKLVIRKAWKLICICKLHFISLYYFAKITSIIYIMSYICTYVSLYSLSDYSMFCVGVYVKYIHVRTCVCTFVHEDTCVDVTYITSYIFTLSL